MKRAGCAFLGCLGLTGLGMVAAGFVFLVGSGGLGRGPGPGPEPEPESPRPGPTPRPTPTPDPERYLPEVGELRDFQRQDEGARYRLSYGFIDYNGRPHRVSCTIARADLERERLAFGYDPQDIERLENARLQQLVDGEIARRRLAPHFQFSVQGNDYHWNWHVQGDPGPEESARIAGESRQLSAWIERDLDGELQKIRAELYVTRGFLHKQHELSIDYATLVGRGTAPLEDCFQALQQAGAGSSRRQYLGLFLAFFQELAYELPPDRDGRRKTMGFWVPPEVLVRGRGDCDSKSAAFAALWRHFTGGLLLIVLPQHVLVGVEATPGPGERYVRLGNRYYLLCEVAGPAKLHPGAKDVSGSFEYVQIAPLRPGAS